MHIALAEYVSKKHWNYAGLQRLNPEEVICKQLTEKDKHCSWCEGASINILIKAATLDVLEKLNTFSDREDAVRRYLEAQLTILAKSKNEIIDQILSISKERLINNIIEICSDDIIKHFYPKIRFDFICLLSDSITRSDLFDIASIFSENPYDYRSGWPDITVIDKSGIEFIEVKTTDYLHASQLRFASDIAKPLGLSCSVYQLKPK